MFNCSHDEGTRLSSCRVLVINSQTPNFGRCSVGKYIRDSHLVICDEYGCFDTHLLPGPTESRWTGTVLAQLCVTIADKHKTLWQLQLSRRQCPLFPQQFLWSLMWPENESMVSTEAYSATNAACLTKKNDSMEVIRIQVSFALSPN
jgi:hypothetical protein